LLFVIARNAKLQRELAGELLAYDIVVDSNDDKLLRILFNLATGRPIFQCVALPPSACYLFIPRALTMGYDVVDQRSSHGLGVPTREVCSCPLCPRLLRRGELTEHVRSHFATTCDACGTSFPSQIETLAHCAAVRKKDGGFSEDLHNYGWLLSEAKGEETLAQIRWQHFQAIWFGDRERSALSAI
jgi:hypothetical protein